MTSSRNLIFALAVTGVAAVAAIFGLRHRKQRLQAVQHRLDLQAWENEGGSTPRSDLDEPEAAVSATESRDATTRRI
jgi:hypothetical protein